ncbi:hypothetical protein OO013_18785 [Mangrovivirga sp. M17]|uniref:ATP synthase protein I n=1 Tax=Mangrovivirga halotolerans TaxID=2993936 RepID=A0ABT3RVY9_9BACT|nr:hypothetical protein [Mangrovivirga halotolerans]MCX2745934.1 hypothetical protein [Mangrovivirga halotolerans]
MQKYLFGLGGLSLLCVVGLFLIDNIYPQSGLDLRQSYLVFFFALITFFIHSFVVKVGDDKQVGIIFIGGAVVKLIFTILLMLVIKFLDPTHFTNKMIYLAVLYLLYTMYEVGSLIKVLNK